jgi:hypothetical protein
MPIGNLIHCSPGRAGGSEPNGIVGRGHLRLAVHLVQDVKIAKRRPGVRAQVERQACAELGFD